MYSFTASFNLPDKINAKFFFHRVPQINANLFLFTMTWQKWENFNRIMKMLFKYSQPSKRNFIVPTWTCCYCVCVNNQTNSKVKRPLWEQKNMFGTRIMVIWEEQLVDPLILYITSKVNKVKFNPVILCTLISFVHYID